MGRQVFSPSAPEQPLCQPCVLGYMSTVGFGPRLDSNFDSTIYLSGPEEIVKALDAHFHPFPEM